MWCGGALEERVLRKRRGVGVRGAVLQESEGGQGRPGVGVWGAWRWGGVRAAEAGSQSVLEETGQVWGQEKEGKGVETHLVDGGGEGVRRSV